MRNLLGIGLLFLGLSGAGLADEPLVLRGDGWIGAIAFSPDSRRLAIGAGDGSVSICDINLAKKIAGFRAHTDAVAALAWSPDGRLLASGSHDRTVLLKVPAADAGQPAKALRGHAGAVLAAVFAADGKTLFTGGLDAAIRAWNIETGAEVKVCSDHMSWVNGLALNCKSTLLASAGSDNSVQVHRLPNLAPVRRYEIKEGEIRAVAISPDDRWIAAGIRYGGVRVWDHAAGKEVFSQKAHAGETWAVAFTPDGKTLASGGGDWNKPGEVRLWDTATWKERASLPHTGEVLCLAISPDGRFLAAGSWDRTVRIWRLDPGRRPGSIEKE